jgi:hypothetical protein
MDPDGQPIEIGVDYDTVSIRVGTHIARLTAAGVEEFAHLIAAATWQAGAQSARMAEEAGRG